MKVHEYNEMMAYMLRPRQKFAIGGGVVEGEDLGSREGFNKPQLNPGGAPGQEYKIKFGPSKVRKENIKFGGPRAVTFFGTYEEMKALSDEYLALTKKSYEKGVGKSADIAKTKKEKELKKLVDEVFETGDFINFKSKPTESQLRFAEKKGKVRRGTGKVPAQYIRQIKNAVEAGVDSSEFKDLLRITGRTQEEILELHNKAPMGKVPFQVRSKATLDFPPKPLLTEEEKLETQRKTRQTRVEKESIGKKYASEAELERFNLVNNQKKKLNKFFKNSPNAINNTEFGKQVKNLMNVRLNKQGEIIQNIRPDSYYIEKAKEGKIFDIFDINKIAKGQRMTKFTSNLNILPGQFNQGFIEAQVNKFFKKGGRLEGQTDKLKNVDEFLKGVGVKVDIEDVGRIGGGNPVFYESNTGKFPHIYDTLKNMKMPDTLLTDINPTINIEGVTTADKVERPESAKTRDMFKDFSTRTSAMPFLDPKAILTGLGDVARFFGTPSVAATFAGTTIKENLEKGDSLLDAATDKMVGIDLLYPELAKQTVGRFAQPTGRGILSMLGRVAMNPFGRAARAFTPVGAGITAIGLGKDYYDFIQRDLARKAADPEAYAAEQEEQMGMSA